VATSRGTWQRFETDIKNMIGGIKQYAQSVKHFVRSEKLALGDVKNKYILAECKLRDYATKKFRKEYPAKPYKSFNIEYIWWQQLVQECADINKNEKVNRVPVMFCKPKYGREEHILVVMDGKDWLKWMEIINTEFTTYLTLPKKQNSKSVTIKYGDILPKMVVYGGGVLFVMDINTFNLAKSLWHQSENK
jgi:hypothetical protein